MVFDPAKVRTPQHKGRVERSIPLVRQQVLAGRRVKDIEEANTYALHWCRHEVSQRVTRAMGRTPWDLFTIQEKDLLKSLPAMSYECSLWQEAKVHRDCHLVFEGSFYFVPCAYAGHTVWVKASLRLVEVYYQEKRIKAHSRSQQKGQWVTDQQDYPEAAQRFLDFTPQVCLQEAQALGQHVYLFPQEVLKNPSKVAQRKAQAILRLGEQFDGHQLDEACRRCLAFENTHYQSLKRVLTQGIKDEVKEESDRPIVISPSSAFLRSAHEFSSVH